MADERRYYEIAGMSVQVDSDLPFAEDTFDRKFEDFRRSVPGDDVVAIRHHFGLPDDDLTAGGEEVYRRSPWVIWRQADGWVYEAVGPGLSGPELVSVAHFSVDHARGELYNPARAAAWWREGGLGALTMFPSDQIWLARLVADRDACYLHSGGMMIDGRGLLFVGHSSAGKSTTMGLVKAALGERATILCDDRNIVRRWADGFRAHGTWSHGDVPDVSSAGPPLCAVLFIEQAGANEIAPLKDRKAVWQRLLATLIRPLVTADWMRKEMDVLERLVAEVPCYTMRFDRSGDIVGELERLVR